MAANDDFTGAPPMPPTAALPAATPAAPKPGTPGAPARSMFEFAAPDNPNHVELSDDQLRQKYASNFFSPYAQAHGLTQSMDQVRSYDRWMQYLNGNATDQQAMALPHTMGAAGTPQQQAYNQRLGAAWDTILKQDPSMAAHLPENMGLQNGKVGFYDTSQYSRDAATGNLTQRSWLDRHDWIKPALVMGGLATAGIAGPAIAGALGGGAGGGGGAGAAGAAGGGAGGAGAAGTAAGTVLPSTTIGTGMTGTIAGAVPTGMSTGSTLGGVLSGVAPRAIQGGVTNALQSGAQSGWNPRAMLTGGLTGAAGGAVGGIGGNLARGVSSPVTSTAIRAGTGAAQSGIASGGDPRAMLTGAAMAGTPTARMLAPNASQGTQQLLQGGLNVGKGAVAGGGRGALTAGLSTGLNAIPGANTQAGNMATRVGTNYLANFLPQQQQPSLSNGRGLPPGVMNFSGTTTPTGQGGFGTGQGGTTPYDLSQPANSGSGWLDKYGPLIATGGGAVVTGILAKRAQEAAGQMTPQEQAALGGLGNLAGAAGQTGQSLISQARPWIEQPANYYQALLSGDRAKQMQAVAPQMAQLTDVYRGAGRNLEQSGIRGAARDVASGELARERASKIAGLVTGVQPAAASALANLGTTTLQQGAPLINAATAAYGTVANDYWRNRYYAQQAGTEAGKAYGGLTRDIINALPWGKGSQPGVQLPTPPQRDAPGTTSGVNPNKQWENPNRPPASVYDDWGFGEYTPPSREPDWGNDPGAGQMW